MKAKFIYAALLKVKDELEQAIYKERCGQLDTFIRQCTSSLSGSIATETSLTYKGDSIEKILQ